MYIENTCRDGMLIAALIRGYLTGKQYTAGVSMWTNEWAFTFSMLHATCVKTWLMHTRSEWLWWVPWALCGLQLLKVRYLRILTAASGSEIVKWLQFQNCYLYSHVLITVDRLKRKDRQLPFLRKNSSGAGISTGGSLKNKHMMLFCE